MYCRHLCDGNWQCPDGEDEGVCTKRSCEALFHCSLISEKVCLHLASVCDGTFDCFSGEDEYLCDLQGPCPHQCQCLLYAVYCEHDSTLTLPDFTNKLQSMVFSKFVNITVYFQVESVDISKFPNLVYFSWTKSMLDIICFRLSSFSESLKFLDLSNNDAKKVLSNCFDHLPVLKMLLLKCNRIEDINPNAFGGLSQVFMLDLSGNKLVSLCSTFYEALEIRVFNITDNSFQEINFGQLGNLHLDVIATDDYRICCLLLESETICTASPTWPQNCNILLHDTPAEIFDIVFALVATTVNIAGIVWGIVESIKMKRTKFQMVGSVKIVKKENKSLSFVTNIIFLHTNDLIFGVYLLIIFACSKLYEKNYPVESPNWLQSPLCKFLSCISLLGLTNSLFVVHLLTMSRLFATKYPFKSIF